MTHHASTPLHFHTLVSAGPGKLTRLVWLWYAGDGHGRPFSQSRKGHDAVYHNPAGLLSDERPSCAVGFSFGAQSLRLDGRTFDTPNTSQTHIGGAIPLPRRLHDRATRLGFWVYRTN